MTEGSSLHQLRRLILAIVLLGITGLVAELLFIEHFESWQQLVPIVALALAFALAAVLAVRPTRGAVRAFQVVMAGFVVVGLAGLYLHYLGNVEFELERHPELGGPALAWEALRGATPALAPGAMIQLGLLGLVYAYRHPVLRRTQPDSLMEER
ncbi:MAG: hypothetical protein M3Y31_00650 [Gemmatimonadota bacterium]|nr:hypothetical protein [Gemmatimonadota bacterium]